MVCKLYIRMKIREEAVEEQIQWILSYVQEELVDMWKKNILEDLETELLKYKIIGEFLAEIKMESGEGDKEVVKIAELRRLEQREKTIKDFVQKFKRVVRRSGYKERPLVEESKKDMNKTIY